MKTIKIIIGVFIIFLLLPMLFSSIGSARTLTYTQVTPGVTTTSETDSDVVLLKDLWHDDAVSVTAITSSDADDTPAFASYTPATNTLNVQGLATSTTRTLTVTYEYARLTEYPGADIMTGIIPFLIIIAIVVLIAFSLWSGRK